MNTTSNKIPVPVCIKSKTPEPRTPPTNRKVETIEIIVLLVGASPVQTTVVQPSPFLLLLRFLKDVNLKF